MDVHFFLFQPSTLSTLIQSQLHNLRSLHTLVLRYSVFEKNEDNHTRLISLSLLSLFASVKSCVDNLVIFTWSFSMYREFILIHASLLWLIRLLYKLSCGGLLARDFLKSVNRMNPRTKTYIFMLQKSIFGLEIISSIERI